MYNAWPPSHVDRPDRLLRFVGLMREIGRNIGAQSHPLMTRAPVFFIASFSPTQPGYDLSKLRLTKTKQNKNKTKKFGELIERKEGKEEFNVRLILFHQSPAG